MRFFDFFHRLHCFERITDAFNDLLGGDYIVGRDIGRFEIDTEAEYNIRFLFSFDDKFGVASEVIEALVET